MSLCSLFRWPAREQAPPFSDIFMVSTDQYLRYNHFPEGGRPGILWVIKQIIFKGFKVSFVDDHVYHDFTKEAIAESLTNFLRPQLAEIVHRVAQEESQTEKD